MFDGLYEALTAWYRRETGEAGTVVNIYTGWDTASGGCDTCDYEYQYVDLELADGSTYRTERGLEFFLAALLGDQQGGETR